ncbi:internal scaffolding protein [Dipodfec virus UOA04_Rod_680]|nr:internal scaffolding protein [Dipodfec virus UOA04_Rod_680]
MKFNSFYTNRPDPVTCVPDTETKFVDQSEADRASLKFQLERYGFDSLQQQFEKTKSQFGYADTRFASSFAELHQKMADANSYFMQLPARIRSKFDHSAVKFFESIENDPERAYNDKYISKSLAAKLGVASAIDKPVVVEPQPEPVVDKKVDVVDPLPNTNPSA